MEKRWKILLITSVGLFMASLDLFIVNLALPSIARDFDGASFSSLSWVLNGYAIVFAALLVPAGRIADRIGRKRIFISGLLLFSLASALCAAAPAVPFLVAARVLQAAGGSMMLPTTLGLILPAFPPEKRAVAVGIWSAVGGVAAALGPGIGGILLELSWRWIFLVNVPIGLATALVAWRTLDEIREPHLGARPDGIGALELALGIGLLTAGIVKGPDWGWADARIIFAFVGSVLLVAAFVLRSARHPAPVIELPMLRVRSFSVANTAALVFFAGFGAMLLSSVLLLTEVWRYSVLHAGLALMPGPLMAAIFAAPAGRLGAKVGQAPVIAAGGLVFASGFAVNLSLLSATPDYAGSFLPGFLLGGAGVGLVLGPLPAAATMSLPPDRFATGTAVFGMARQVGAAIGVAVLVALLANPAPDELFSHLQRGWAFAMGTGIAAGLLGLAIGSPRREREDAVIEGLAPQEGAA
ncbi:MAG: DHA2 family efflux MFS transporter permease subunit [Solirubrobacterales bacterium]